MKLNEWQARVKVLRSTDLALLNRIPQLDTLLRIFEGDTIAIEENCRNNWLKYCLSLMLYAYAPPLGRPNIRKIVEDAMRVFKGGMTPM